MSSFTVSKIRTARKQRTCVVCEHQISNGEQYLSYAPGQRCRVPVHLQCAAKNEGLWDCADLRAYLAGLPADICDRLAAERSK